METVSGIDTEYVKTERGGKPSEIAAVGVYDTESSALWAVRQIRTESSKGLVRCGCFAGRVRVTGGLTL